MATDKRDRQRANREEKKAAEAKKAKYHHWFVLGRKWVFYGVLIFAGLLAFRLFTG